MSISDCLLIWLSNEFVFPNPEPPIIINLQGWSGIWGQFGLCSFVFFFFLLHHLRWSFYALFYYTSSSFVLHVKILHFSYAYVTPKSIDCILLSQSALNVILLTSSIKILYLFLLNLCSIFDINLLFLWTHYGFL